MLLFFFCPSGAEPGGGVKITFYNKCRRYGGPQGMSKVLYHTSLEMERADGCQLWTGLQKEGQLVIHKQGQWEKGRGGDLVGKLLH